MNMILAVLGVVLVVLGVFTGGYTVIQSQLFGLVSTSSTPYSEYSVPLLIGGIVLILVGMFAGDKK